MSHTQTSARAHDDSILSVVWLDASRVITGSIDGSIRVWTITDGKLPSLTRTIPRAHLLGVTSLSSETGGHHFCSASIGEISVWNSDEDIPLATLACGHMEAVGLQWSPAAGLLAGGSQSGCLNFFSVIESATEGKWTISLIAAVSTRSNSMVMSTAFSADGMRAAAGHTDGTVSIFDTETHSFVTTIRTPHDLPIRSLAFSVDGNTLVTGCEDSRVGLMAAAGSGSSSSNGGNGGGGGAGSSTTMIAAATNASLLSGHLAFITCVATSPIKNIIASSSADKTIRLWDTTNGEALFTLSVHGDKTNAVAFSPDGIKLASVSDAGTLAISNVNALKE